MSGFTYSNNMEMFRVYAAAALIGAVSGLRSMTGPAIVSRAAACGDLRLKNSGLDKMASATTANLLTLFAAGEMVADKTPYVPNRISPAPLLGRIVSGGVCGAAICYSERQSVLAGALLGGLAAVGGSFLGFHLRRRIVQEQQIPDLQVAVAEDLIALSGGIAAVASLR